MYYQQNVKIFIIHIHFVDVLHACAPEQLINSRALESCYNTCMALVLKYNIKTVVFCGLGIAIYRYPLYDATNIALKTIRTWLLTGENRFKVDKIIFCTFLDVEKTCYEKLMHRFFPIE